MTTTQAAPSSRPSRSVRRRLNGAPTTGDGIEILEPSLPAYARTPGDLVRVVGAVVTVLTALLAAAIFRASISGADADVTSLANKAPGPLQTTLNVLSQYVGFIGAIGLVVALAFVRRLRVTVEVVLALVLGVVAMYGVRALLALNVELPMGLGALRSISGGQNNFLLVMAAAAAALTVLSPWIDSAWTRAGAGLIAIAAFVRIAPGFETAYDIAVAIVLGWLVGSVLVLIFGSPNKQPIGIEIAEALADAGIDVRRLEYTGLAVRGSTIYLADTAEGRHYFVKAFSPDQPEADRLVQYWRWIRLREADRGQRFANLRRFVEHEAFCSLAAADSGIPSSKLELIAEVRSGGMVLAYAYVGNERLEGLGSEAITDDLLRKLWGIVARMHEARIAHRDLRLAHVLLDADGEPVIVDFGDAEVAAKDQLLRTDVAELLCSIAVEVGPRRAVDTAVAVLGRDSMGDMLPRLQPLALRTVTRRALAQQEGLLKELQAEVQRVTGIEEVQYEELARLKPRTLVGFVVFTLALYLLLPRVAEVGDIGAALASAQWWWIIPLVAFQIVTYIGAAFGIEGSVPDRLAFVPTFWGQVAAAFVDVLAPNALGGFALNTRFLQKQGVDSGVAVAGVGLNAIAGFVAHVAILGAFLLWVGSGNQQQAPVDVSSIWPILVAFVVFLVVMVVISLVVPPLRALVRKRVVPLLREAGAGMGELARRPRKLVALFGGSAMVTLGFLGALLCAVHAFGGDVPIAEVGVAYLIVSTVALVAPTPGGTGAVEPALIAALTKLGMSSAEAVSAVLLFRTCTFWLPVLPGWIAFHVMQRHGDL